jgi:cytochrome c oxidase subunit 2
MELSRLNRAPRVFFVPLALLLTVVVLLVAGCQPQEDGGPAGPAGAPFFGLFPPPSATEQGAHIGNLYNVVFWIAAAIFLLVEGLIVWAVLRYRRRDDALPKQTHGNLVMEAIWTTIPAIIVIVLFVMSIDTLGKVEAKSADPAVTVDVTGFQWQWQFEYKEDGVKLVGAGEQGPELVLPVGETVNFKLHATDVIHAFYVPQFLYKKDVMPGRTNSFDLRIDAPGTYAGQCAEFCGLDHARMNFTVRAVPRPEYDQWLAAEIQKANATPAPAPSGAVTLELSASNALSFDEKTAEAPADTPLTIAFLNQDVAAPHNVAIRQANPDGSDFVGQPLANAGETVNYNAPPLKAGQYEYFCSVHPNMQGTLNVE